MLDGALRTVVRGVLTTAVVAVGVVGAWWLIIRIFDIQEYVVPPPGAVWTAFVDSASFLWPALWVTLYESVVGFALSIVVGLALATIMVYSPLLRGVIMPSLVGLNATPKVALAPVLILWLGLGINSKIGMAFLLSFFPVVVNAVRGLDEADPELLDYFRLLRAGRLRTFLKVRLPNSLPTMFDGFKIALPIAVVGAVIGEFVASQEGIGYQIIVAYSTFSTGIVFAAVILIAVASTVLYGGLVLLERVLLRWRPSSGKPAV
ncbi:ABC transporter permease [Nocardioides ginsengisoli]|uniref:ABC transporter permease n=1 Tax=Nocardioides ginsengisoli TaxID=363868 RepID=A0ABW3W718_9ACTN